MRFLVTSQAPAVWARARNHHSCKQCAHDPTIRSPSLADDRNAVDKHHQIGKCHSVGQSRGLQEAGSIRSKYLRGEFVSEIERVLKPFEAADGTRALQPVWALKILCLSAHDGRAKHPLPVVRIGERAVRFDPDKISTYIRSRERHRPNARLGSFDGVVRANRKGKYKLARRRFQNGSVKLRADRGPAYWQGFYREDIINEAGKTVRTRKSVILGSREVFQTKRSPARSWP